MKEMISETEKRVYKETLVWIENVLLPNKCKSKSEVYKGVKYEEKMNRKQSLPIPYSTEKLFLITVGY